MTSTRSAAADYEGGGGRLVLHTDERFAATVEAVVGELEDETDAEIVVVAAPRSGSYRDVAVVVGAVTGWLGLCFALYSPFHFGGVWLPVELPLLGLFFGAATARAPWVLRRLTTKRRRAQQVLAAAHAAFYEEAIYGTLRRTGLLVYVSGLEDQVVVLADGAIEAHVPRGALNTVRWGDGYDPSAPGDLEHFVVGMRQLGRVLAAYVPHREGDNPNEISDAPRIRS